MLKIVKNLWKGFLLAIAFSATALFGQDPEFTQFYSAPLNLNPALAGTSQCSRATLNYRNQWNAIGQGFNAGYVSYMASYDHFAKGIKSGLGMSIMVDNQGAMADPTGTSDGLAPLITMNYITGTYAYRMYFDNEMTMQIGMQAAYVSPGIDINRLIFEDQLDALQGYVNSTTSEQLNADPTSVINFNAGAVLYNDNFYGGIAVKNLTEPNPRLSFVENSAEFILKRRITVHGGAIIPLNKRYNQETYLAPEFIFTTQGPAKQLNMGVYWDNRTIFAGMWARYTFSNFDAFVPYVGLKQEAFQVSYSFDFTVSKLQTAQSLVGTHEIAIIFKFCPKIRSNVQYCPRLT